MKTTIYLLLLSIFLTGSLALTVKAIANEKKKQERVRQENTPVVNNITSPLRSLFFF